MKCEIMYGPEAGTIKHFANNDNTAHTLIKSGMLRLVENEPGDMVRMGNGQIIPKMGPPVQPRWTVGTATICHIASGGSPVNAGEHIGNRIPAIIFEVGFSVREQYAGEPKYAHQGFGRRVVPDDILKQYKQAYRDFYGK